MMNIRFDQTKHLPIFHNSQHLALLKCADIFLLDNENKTI